MFLALVAWWLSTGAVLYLNHLPRDTYRWSLFGATIILLACLYGLAVGRADATPLGALLAFSEALLVWAWLEMSYFMDFLTGSSKRPCPPTSSEWSRFRRALETSLHHELAVAAFGIGLIALTWDSPNQIGSWTYVTLWLMRWSAKLNIFLGVPNINVDWLPEHLQFLESYIRRRPLNLLFPISITVSTFITTILFLRAGAGDPFEMTGYTLVATLLALAVLEHWFLVLPVKDSALWTWALEAAKQNPIKHRETAWSSPSPRVGDAMNGDSRLSFSKPAVATHGPSPPEEKDLSSYQR